MALPVKEICFAQDTEERRKWFKAASFSHPAKMVLGLQIYLIEHYTKPGEVICDPMSGSGTILVACALGRHVICVELEPKFIKMIEANWQKIKSLGPMLGYKMGEATILQGDARQLPKPLVDKCIFSPPYAETLGTKDQKFWDKICDKGKNWEGTTRQASDYGKSEGQISSLPYGQIDCVCTSPPYNAEPTCSESYKKIRTKTGRDITKPSQQYAKYADAVITSPPYEGTDVAQDKKWLKEKANFVVGSAKSDKYAPSNNNIGNLKSDNYLEAMLAVYQNCHKVLKDGGLLCLVVKNFIRDKKIVRLDTDTIKLCEKAGFVLKERLKRKLTSQSFWRIIYAQRFPDAPKIEHEDVLVFEKGE